VAGLRVLVVGGGAREHALVWRLAQDPDVADVWAAPGNDGMEAAARRVPLAADGAAQLADWAEARGVDLTVVGPEVPLAAGIADRFAARGLAILGPTAAAAEVETSKAWAKEFCRRHRIPTAEAATFDSAADAEAHLSRASLPVVVKADGLAAGKGVVVAREREEAVAAARRLGGSGRVLVEEFLEGRELSAFALCDGRDLALLPAARDYKRLLDGDAGPNTGGMGAYSPVGEASDELLEAVRRQVLEPAVEGLRAEGRPFRGFLYAGLMLTAQGPRLLEFNARLGDPEAQVILPRWLGSVAGPLLAAARGALGTRRPAFRPEAAAAVVLATPGYPEAPRTGQVIEGLDPLGSLAGALVFHAATRRDGLRWKAEGGRVLSVVGVGPGVAAARRRAYAAAEAIRFPGRQLRSDVALQEDDAGA
jgi:phosphoribosylamine--glycine ligase